MDLATHQRALRDLLAGEEPADDDAYLTGVAASDALDVLQDVGRSWRRYTFGRTCPLTWRTIEGCERSEALLTDFGRLPGLSPYLPERTRRFLDLAAGDGHPLVAAVARFERSVLRTDVAAPDRLAGEDDVVIDWPADPRTVLVDLGEGRAPTLGADGGHARYRTRAPATQPTRLTITEL